MNAPEYELTTEGKDTVLVIKCRFPKKPEISKSGKSELYATTNGNAKTGLKINGQDLIVGINAYTAKR